MHGLLDPELDEFLREEKRELDKLVGVVEEAIYDSSREKKAFDTLIEHYAGNEKMVAALNRRKLIGLHYAPPFDELRKKYLVLVFRGVSREESREEGRKDIVTKVLTKNVGVIVERIREKIREKDPGARDIDIEEILVGSY